MKASTKPEFHIPARSMLMGMLALFLMLNFAFASVSAMNEWLDTDPVERTSTVNKPVDPVFINTGNDSIVIPIGESWDFIYNLKSGHRYHIFLVGDWIHNASSPMTDYDIYTYKPSGAPFSSHTESAGLPEQVSTDENHHYFIPDQSGEYTFRIVNDERDSENDETAILMVLEHVDVNTEHSQFLEGRDSNDNEVLYTGWAFEFNTNAPEIRIFVDVPSLLDMYEARLFAMAKPESDIGYSLYGIGVPLGEFFTGFSGEYGGFNTYSQGDRNIEAMDSGEYSGQDLGFIYDAPTSENGSDIFYYLVLIAEHSQGTVDFVVQTDFEPPVISLDPPEVGVEGEPTEITVTVEDDTEIEEIWIEYSTDEGETWRTKDLSERGDGYSCELGSLLAGDFVEFTIYAEDAFGNIDSIESGFQVKRIISLECFVADKNLYVDESARITGSSTLEIAQITLQFAKGETVESFLVTTDENGGISFNFAPPLLGEWRFQALFEGSETEFPASSNLVNFTVDSRETHISGFLSESEVKKNKPIVVSGSVIPKIPGLSAEVLFVSSAGSHSEKVSTSADGSFTCFYEPADVGVWNVLAKVGDGFFYAISQSEMMEFEVLPLTIIDKAYVTVQMMIEPPYLYGTVGLLGIGISSVVYVKRDTVISSLPSGLGKRLGKNSGKKKGKNGKNGKRYRRKKK
jgi:hypothetical protein